MLRIQCFTMRRGVSALPSGASGKLGCGRAFESARGLAHSSTLCGFGVGKRFPARRVKRQAGRLRSMLRAGAKKGLVGEGFWGAAGSGCAGMFFCLWNVGGGKLVERTISGGWAGFFAGQKWGGEKSCFFRQNSLAGGGSLLP